MCILPIPLLHGFLTQAWTKGKFFLAALVPACCMRCAEE